MPEPIRINIGKITDEAYVPETPEEFLRETNELLEFIKDTYRAGISRPHAFNELNRIQAFVDHGGGTLDENAAAYKEVYDFLDRDLEMDEYFGDIPEPVSYGVERVPTDHLDLKISSHNLDTDEITCASCGKEEAYGRPPDELVKPDPSTHFHYCTSCEKVTRLAGSNNDEDYFDDGTRDQTPDLGLSYDEISSVRESLRPSDVSRQSKTMEYRGMNLEPTYSARRGRGRLR